MNHLEDEPVHVPDATTQDQIERGEVTPPPPPQDGSNLASASEEPPRRSWSRTKSAANGWDAHFTYDGATVYIKTLSRDDRAEISASEKQLQADVKALQELLSASTSGEQQQEISEQMAELQVGFMQSLLVRTVRFWSGGEQPYSAEAVFDLPLEIMADWVPLILQKSVMGKTEAEALGNV